MSSRAAMQRRIDAMLAVTHETEGWDSILPAASAILQRMLDHIDASPSVREQHARSLLRIITSDPHFLRSPLGQDLSSVAAAYTSPTWDSDSN
jgi:hypothetical protein